MTVDLSEDEMKLIRDMLKRCKNNLTASAIEIQRQTMIDIVVYKLDKEINDMLAKRMFPKYSRNN